MQLRTSGLYFMRLALSKGKVIFAFCPIWKGMQQALAYLLDDVVVHSVDH